MRPPSSPSTAARGGRGRGRLATSVLVAASGALLLLLLHGYFHISFPSPHHVGRRSPAPPFMPLASHHASSSWAWGDLTGGASSSAAPASAPDTESERLKRAAAVKAAEERCAAAATTADAAAPPPSLVHLHAARQTDGTTVRFPFPQPRYRLYTRFATDASSRCRHSGICDDGRAVLRGDCGADGLGCTVCPSERQAAVREAALWSWNAYRCGWGGGMCVGGEWGGEGGRGRSRP